MNTRVEVEGLKQVLRNLKRLGVDVADLKEASNKAGQVVADAARSLAPTKTGRLSNSVRAMKQQNAAVVKAGGARLPYAGVVHFGWPSRNIKPQPFLFEAADARRQQVIDAYREGLAEAIKKANLN